MASRRGRTNKFSAGITWKEVRRSLKGILVWFLRVTWFLDYINPFQIYTRWRRRGCVYDSDGSVVIFKQTLLQRIKDSFVTDTARRRRLLDWVQSLVPAMDINDFSACWSNGVALCALMDALVPGACPELARLKPYHKLNNIRLALKLANKFFALPLNAFRAEEIAIYGSHHPRRVYELLTVIRMLHVRACAAGGSHAAWAFGRAPKDSGDNEGEGAAMSAAQQNPSPSVVYCRNIARLCRLRKGGHQTGTVAKDYTCDVWFPDGLNPDGIRVDVFPLEEVSGFLLDGEISNDVPSGMPDDLKMNEEQQQSEQADESTDEKLPLARDDSLKAAGQYVLTSTSCGENDQTNNRPSDIENGVIVKATGLPVARSLQENGLLRFSFCPTSVGRYRVSATFGQEDVEGSPLIVSVSPDFGAQSSADEPSRKRLTFAEAAEIIIAKARNSRIYRQLLQNERAPSSSKNSLYDVAAAVLRRTSKVKRTLAFRGSHTQSIINSEKAVVKRRKILKQMITRGGQEIVIDRASTSFDESTNWSAAAAVVSLPGSSERSRNFDTLTVNACLSFRTEEVKATDGEERNQTDCKPGCHLVVPRSDDAAFHCSPLSSAVERPHRGDLFEAYDIAFRSVEPNESRLTSSEHPACTTRAFENQDEMSHLTKDPSKDGDHTAESQIEVKDSYMYEIATDEPTTSALTKTIDLKENQRCDEQSDHLALNGKASETDARSRRNHFKTSSARECSLAGQHRKPDLGVPDDVALLGAEPLGDNSENRLQQGAVGSLSFDRSQPEEDSVNANDRLLFLLPTEHLEKDAEGKGENEKHWPAPSTLIDYMSADQTIRQTVSVACSYRRGSLTRQEAVLSMGPDVHNAAVSPQQERVNHSRTEEGHEPRDGDREKEDDQTQATTSKEPWTNSPKGLPSVLMVDRWTQVKYEEIKEDTGWKRPVRRVSPRKCTRVVQETKPMQNDESERPSSFKGPESNSGNDSWRPSRKSKFLHDKANTEGSIEKPWTVNFRAEPDATSDDTQHSKKYKNQFEKGLKDPQSSAEQFPTTSISNRKSVTTSCNSHPSIPGLQWLPDSQITAAIDSVRHPVESAARKDKSECVDCFGSEGDHRSNSSDDASQLRKLDNFFAFLDQFANGHNSQRRQEIARRFSTESLPKDGRSVFRTELRYNASEDIADITSDDDFLPTLLGSGEEERAIPSSSEIQSQSPDGEFWVDAMGGDSSGGDEDNEDVAGFSINRLCTAFGPGLNEGTVGRLNYFQVRILTKHQGHLTVEMSGHRLHSVLEQSVAYIGDSVYDVTYEVSNPGVYSIAVKWANCHVQGSPFVCAVTL